MKISDFLKWPSREADYLYSEIGLKVTFLATLQNPKPQMFSS